MRVRQRAVITKELDELRFEDLVSLVATLKIAKDKTIRCPTILAAITAIYEVVYIEAKKLLTR